jgi:hypothetical protein
LQEQVGTSSSSSRQGLKQQASVGKRQQQQGVQRASDADSRHSGHLLVGPPQQIAANRAWAVPSGAAAATGGHRSISGANDADERLSLHSFSSCGTATATRRGPAGNRSSDGGAVQQLPVGAASVGCHEGAGVLTRNSSSNGHGGLQSRRSTLSGASSASSSGKVTLPAVASSVQGGDSGSGARQLCSHGSSKQLPAVLPPVRGALW